MSDEAAHLEPTTSEAPSQRRFPRVLESLIGIASASAIAALFFGTEGFWTIVWDVSLLVLLVSLPLVWWLRRREWRARRAARVDPALATSEPIARERVRVLPALATVVALLALVTIAACAVLVVREQHAQTKYDRAVACWQRAQAAGSTFGAIAGLTNDAAYKERVFAYLISTMGSCRPAGFGTGVDVSPSYTVPTTTATTP